MEKTIYSFEAELNSGEKISFERYQKKPLLIINTASKCGFTSQYKDLEELYGELQGKMEILAFPCDQFAGQEFSTDQEIKEFCSLNYKVSFPLFKKINVNGEDAHPLFKYLKECLPGLLGSEAIKWNFTKFLVDANGIPVKRYAPKDNPRKIKKDIEDLF